MTRAARLCPDWSDGRVLCALADFQLWCLGQDIRHPNGNLLLAYGASRVRAPEGSEGSTRYVIPAAAPTELLLWGFALVVRESGNRPTVLRRHQRTLRLLPASFCAETVWRPEHLPRGVSPRVEPERIAVHRGLEVLAQQLITYERWLRKQVGAAWRNECHRRMPRAKQLRSPGQPELLAESWALICAALPDCASACANPIQTPSTLSA